MIQTKSASLDIIWPRLISIADEVATALIRTAFSHDVIEVHDMSVGIFDAQGLMLAQTPKGTTGHTVPMSPLMKKFVRDTPPDDIRPGDVFVTNDPWIQSGHTADVYVITPVFDGSRLVGYVLNTVHHLDIGGRAGSALSEEVYEEGLVMPLLKLQEEGRPNQTLFKLFERNFRFSEKVIGDFRAQIAAGHVGGERLLALMKEKGLRSLDAVSDEIIGRSEASMRAGIRGLGEGTRRMDLSLGISTEQGEPLKVSLALTVKGDVMCADFTGTSPQVRSPINCPYNFTSTYVIVPAKMVCAPDTPNNEGTFRPFEFNIPEGCILNPRFPAAVYWRFTSGHIVADLAYMLLAEVAPDRSLAGSGTLPTWYFHTSGLRKDQSTFMLHSHGFGGMGGRPGRDGLSAVGFPYTVRNVPTEEVETETPLLCLGRRFIPDSGGPGKWRGGMGEEIVMTTAPEADVDATRPLLVSGAGGRLRHPPDGLFGGKPGSRARILVNGEPMAEQAWSGTGAVEFRPKASDVVSFQFPGGGGLGDPLERDRALVQRDLDHGYVTPEAAEREYGYAKDGNG